MTQLKFCYSLQYTSYHVSTLASAAPGGETEVFSWSFSTINGNCYILECPPSGGLLTTAGPRVILCSSTKSTVGFIYIHYFTNNDFLSVSFQLLNGLRRASFL